MLPPMWINERDLLKSVLGWLLIMDLMVLVRHVCVCVCVWILRVLLNYYMCSLFFLFFTIFISPHNLRYRLGISRIWTTRWLTSWSWKLQQVITWGSWGIEWLSTSLGWWTIRWRCLWINRWWVVLKVYALCTSYAQDVITLYHMYTYLLLTFYAPFLPLTSTSLWSCQHQLSRCTIPITSIRWHVINDIWLS